MAEVLPAVIESDATLPPALLEAIESTRRFADAGMAESSLKAYESDWRNFAGWCARHGLEAMPATPDTVAVYLASLAELGRKASTITRRVAAIRYVHACRELEPPTNAERVRKVLRGIRRELGVAPDRKAPLTDIVLAEVLARVPSTRRGKRDRAALALCFAGSLRRSELVALNVEDLERASGGIILHVRRSKNDQEAKGATVPIPNGTRLRPVKLLDAWLEAGEISAGPIFRPVNKGDRVLEQRLSGHGFAGIVKERVEAAGYDPEVFGGHSPRAGFTTAALEHGADPLKVARHNRHAKLDTTLAYDRRTRGFKDHAGSGFL